MDKKVLFIIVGTVGLLLVVGLTVVSILLKRVTPTTVNIWGLWEETGVVSEVVADYQRENSNATIKHVKQSPINYRERLTAALAGVSGPDIFLIHNSWLPMFKNDLSFMPSEVYPPAQYKTTFYPTVSRDFITGGKAFGVPLGFDALALYINEDILAAGGVLAPTTWDGVDGFFTTAKKLTVRDANNRIRTAGTALGTASNVDHWQDILALMMLQAGVDLNSDPGAKKAQEALTFYVSFATTGRIWDETLDSSTLAFAQGKVGMYFGPSWRWFDIKALNPNLKFKVVAVPQLTGADSVNYATYWGAVVSKKSKNQKLAWDYLKFASSRKELTKFYSAAAKLRGFGEPYSRTDMASLLSADPNVGPFINAGPTAKSWYLDSSTFDGETGINSRIGKYYKDAINSMLRGAGVDTVMETVTKGVGRVLKDYK